MNCRLQIRHCLAIAMMSLFASNAFAVGPSTVEITVLPSAVPDEQIPRNNLGDAAPGFETSSWQGPATGKSNWHARYDADGNYLNILFPSDAATLSVSDLASISYFTKRPDGTPAGRDWWVQIYTRPDGVNDAASWYGYRLINNYNDHSNIGDWTQYSTSTGMTFNRNDSLAGALANVELDLPSMISAYGSELIEMISIQTDSGWNGFDGFLDGLEITLTNGNVGRVNFEAVPEPATLGLIGLGAIGCFGMRRRR